MTLLVKKILSIITGLIIVISFSTDAFARKRSTAPEPSNFNNQELISEINRLINNVSPDLNIGIQVKSMRFGDTLYERNPTQMYVPASILKIFTAESALLYLGSGYKFNTVFVTDAKAIKNGILIGNIYLIHSGDPSLTYLDLAELMNTLKAHHIQQINGNVYIDTSAYDQEIYGPGWISNDTRFCYGAPISASIINHNCMVLQVTPNKSVGKPVNIIEDKTHFFSGVQNSGITRPRGTRSCTMRLGTEENGIVLSGCMSKGQRIRGVSAVVSNIIYYNKSLVKGLFQRYGIQINGSILPGTASGDVSVLAVHQSKPLRDLISDMLKKSDNIIAGSIFKKIGEVYTNQPGSWVNGSLAVKHILKQKMGVNTTQMNVLDGSGLSPDNLISPQQMMHVLDFAYHNNTTNYDFISALPIAGIDGTLKNRMKNIKWKVRAKTGTMSGVVALAGYVIAKNQEPLAFVIIINGDLGLGWKYKEMENNIMTSLTRFLRTP